MLNNEIVSEQNLSCSQYNSLNQISNTQAFSVFANVNISGHINSKWLSQNTQNTVFSPDSSSISAVSPVGVDQTLSNACEKAPTLPKKHSFTSISQNEFGPLSIINNNTTLLQRSDIISLQKQSEAFNNIYGNHTCSEKGESSLMPSKRLITSPRCETDSLNCISPYLSISSSNKSANTNANNDFRYL